MTAPAADPGLAGTVPWPPEYAARYVQRGYWEGRSLGEHLWAVADAVPDAVALVDGETRLSYRELTQRADGAALRLRSRGLRRGDRVIVQLPNRWEFVVTLLACLRLGVLPVLALPAHRRHEISHLIRHAQAKAIIVPAAAGGFDYEAMAREIAASAETIEQIFVAGGLAASGGLAALCGRPGDPAAARAELDAAAPGSRDVALFLLSAGTTGLPKLIARTHDDYAYNARRAAQVAGFHRGTVYLAVLPLGHNFPLGCPGILGTFLAGGRVVIAPSPAPEKAFPLIEREQVTATAVVPAIAQRWLEHRTRQAACDLSSLEVIEVGGARLADHVAALVRPTLGCTLQQVYGMGEGLLSFTRLDDPDEVICGTQGRPVCPDDELLVVGPDGNPVPAGTQGILLTRGPYTPRGYYRAREHNSRAFTPDGWYRTGDVVRLRPDGNLVVEGRDKDMILRGGENISAEEVENFAYQVDGVKLAAAIAMPDPELGERVCLYVVPHAGATVLLDDVRAAMERAGAARFKFPERLVIVDALPASSIGKINKKRLREDLRERLALKK